MPLGSHRQSRRHDDVEHRVDNVATQAAEAAVVIVFLTALSPVPAVAPTLDCAGVRGRVKASLAPLAAARP